MHASTLNSPFFKGHFPFSRVGLGFRGKALFQGPPRLGHLFQGDLLCRHLFQGAFLGNCLFQGCSWLFKTPSAAFRSSCLVGSAWCLLPGLCCFHSLGGLALGLASILGKPAESTETSLAVDLSFLLFGETATMGCPSPQTTPFSRGCPASPFSRCLCCWQLPSKLCPFSKAANPFSRNPCCIHLPVLPVTHLFSKAGSASAEPFSRFQ